MFKKRYYSSTDIYYSAIYGGGIYRRSGRRIRDPFAEESKKNEYPTFVSRITGEEYFIRFFQNEEILRKRYQKQILSPPGGDYILWPVDMILVSKKQADELVRFISYKYLDGSSNDGNSGSVGILLFPVRDIYRLRNIRHCLEEIREEERNWTNREIQKMSVEIVQGLEKLNRGGYIYGDLHLSRIYFREDGSVFLDFSCLIFDFHESAVQFDETAKKESGILCPSAEEYPLEFAEPIFLKGQKRELDFDSQNYSLNALLFFLFFGRYAYEGRLIANGPVVLKQYYYKKLLDKPDMPVFIFSEDDYRNRIGSFDEEQRIIRLWERLPWEFHCLFHIALDKKHTGGSGIEVNPPPVRWMVCFHDVKWEWYTKL